MKFTVRRIKIEDEMDFAKVILIPTKKFPFDENVDFDLNIGDADSLFRDIKEGNIVELTVKKVEE